MLHNKYLDIINKVNSLSIIEKEHLYFVYLSEILSLKYDFCLFKKSLGLIGIGEPYKETEFHYLIKPSKDILIYSFSEFISYDRIDFRDIGEDWEHHGFAQRYWTELYGIFKQIER